MIIKFGNWIFRYRNYLFIILYVVIFLPSPPLLQSINITMYTGLFLIILGMIIRGTTIGLEYIVRGGNNRNIYAKNLVTGGIYSICRNPMYLGNLLLLLGFGVFSNSALFTFIIFPIFVFIYYSIIKAEEVFLIGKFGEEFKNYQKNTNTILPDLRNIKSAFKNQKFNWGKVILKEYNSIFLYLTAILLIAVFHEEIGTTLFAALQIALTTIYLIIKEIKRNKQRKEKNSK